MAEERDVRRGRNDRLFRVLLVVVAAVVFLPMLMMAVAMGGWLLTAGFRIATPLLGIAVLVVLLLALLLLGYALYRAAAGGGRPDPALEELRVAYARGDLSDEEFEQRRRRLEREE